MGLNAFTDDSARDLDAQLLAFAQGRVAVGRPVRCLDPGCGRTFTVPPEGDIACPHCTPAPAGLVLDPAWRNRCATCGAVAVDGWCHHCADRGDGYDPRDFIEDGAA